MHDHQRQVQAAFNQAARQYDSVAPLQAEISRRLLERLSWLKHKPQSILDAGCGTGFLLTGLGAAYPEANIIALDFASEMLSMAKQYGSERYHFLCADVAQIPLPNASVDLIVSSCMLQWCPDLPAVFAEFRRILKPAGILLFSSFGPDTLYELRQSWQAADPQHLHVNSFLDLHLIGDALLASGLQDPVMDKQTMTLQYRTVRGLCADLKQLGANRLLQPSENRPSGLMGKSTFAKMAAHYERFRDEADYLPATYEVIYGYAVGGSALESTPCAAKRIHSITL